MSCTAIANQLDTLRDRRREQADIVNSLPNNAGKARAQEVLSDIDADIASTQAQLDLCLAREQQSQHPVPQKITGAVTHIACQKAKSELGDDEPYLIIAAFDMVHRVSVGVPLIQVPTLRVVKIGPWGGMGPGITCDASSLPDGNHPSFWGADGDPEPIAHSQDVIFLVACLEHDGSSPDAIRGAVETNLMGGRINNAHQAYTAYVGTMMSNMKGAIETARLAGLDPLHLNEDELFGAQQLELTTDDLARLNRLETVEKTLRFTDTNKKQTKVENDYTVTFAFTV
jgi:hypothetical protein